MTDREIMFSYDGEEFEAVIDQGRWLAAETLAAEKEFGPSDQQSQYAQGLATIAISIKRRRPQFPMGALLQWPNETIAAISAQINAAIEGADVAAKASEPVEDRPTVPDAG